MKPSQTHLLVLFAVLIAGCSSKPLPPDWQNNAHSALQSYSSAYLRGNSRSAELDFARARNEIASTGRGDLLARAELTRCATRVASLEFDDCAGFAPLAQDAGASERSYAAYLTGHWQDVDPALLPAHHRPILSAAASSGEQQPDQRHRRPAGAPGRGRRTVSNRPDNAGRHRQRHRNRLGPGLAPAAPGLARRAGPARATGWRP